MSDYYRVHRLCGWTVYLYQSDTHAVVLLPPCPGVAWLDGNGLWPGGRLHIPPEILKAAQHMWDERASPTRNDQPQHQHQGDTMTTYPLTAVAGYKGTAVACDRGFASAGAYGKASVGHSGTASADVRGTASAGPNGVICVYYYDHDGVRLRVAIGYVGEDGILPDIPYRVQDGKLVPATTLDKETP